MAYACSGGVFPKTSRVGVVTISGGVGIQLADKAAELDLELPRMPDAAQRKIEEFGDVSEYEITTIQGQKKQTYQSGDGKTANARQSELEFKAQDTGAISADKVS